MLRWMACMVMAATLLPFTANADISSHNISVGGMARTYLLYQPKHMQKPAPVIFLLHGGGAKASSMRKIGFEELAEQYGFALVYPESIDRKWMDGRDSDYAKSHPEVDDVAFFKAVMDELATHGIDQKRIYFTGISNGAIMSYRMACDAADRVAAIAPVAGALAFGYKCEPSRAVPVISFNGTQDHYVKFNGGDVGLGKTGKLGATISVNETEKIWQEMDQCHGNPVTQDLPVLDKSDTTKVTLNYRQGSQNVFYYTIIGGGHTWPGRDLWWEKMFSFTVGATTHQIDATRTIWEFFSSKNL